MIDAGPGSFFLPSLDTSPSSAHGFDLHSESLLRLFGCELIQEAGILLRLPQAAMATGQVLLHRFFCKRSLKEFDICNTALSCTWLAMKLEEVTTVEGKSRLPDLLRVFQVVLRRRGGKGSCLDLSDSVIYRRVKADMLALERRILVELGFVCHVQHPHKFLLSYLKCLEASPELIQEAWNLANDSLRTILCVKYPSNVIACGVIFAAARRLGVPLPERENCQWWLLFDTTIEQILDVVKSLAWIYKQEKILSTDISKLTCYAEVVPPKSEHLDEAEIMSDNSSGITEAKPSSDSETCPCGDSGNGSDLGPSRLSEGDAGCRTSSQGPLTKQSLMSCMMATTRGHSEDAASKLHAGEVLKHLSGYLSVRDSHKLSDHKRRERELDEALNSRKKYRSLGGHSVVPKKNEDRQDREYALHRSRPRDCRTEKRRYHLSGLEDSYRSRGTEVYLSSHRRRH